MENIEIVDLEKVNARRWAFYQDVRWANAQPGMVVDRDSLLSLAREFPDFLEEIIPLSWDIFRSSGSLELRAELWSCYKSLTLTHPELGLQERPIPSWAIRL
jgi:hypothetical protein